MYYYHLLKCIARHYGFSVDTEWQDLSEYHQHKVLYGSDSESIDFSYVSDRGREVTKNHPFEGVIRNLERVVARKQIVNRNEIDSQNS